MSFIYLIVFLGMVLYGLIIDAAVHLIKPKQRTYSYADILLDLVFYFIMFSIIGLFVNIDYPRFVIILSLGYTVGHIISRFSIFQEFVPEWKLPPVD